MSWVECDFEKARLVQGANKRVEWFDPYRMGWLQVDNTLNWQWQFVRFRYDSNDYPTNQKSRPDLFPPRALQLAGEVLAFGETKHPSQPWMRMSSEEHIAASMRHLLEHLSGNSKDSESLKLHLTHSFVRLGMALERYVTQNK